MTIADERDRFDVTKTGNTMWLRLLGRYRFRVCPFFFPFILPSRLTTLAHIVDRPDGLDFGSIRCWLLKIVTLVLDSDRSLVPRSFALPRMSAGADDDDFRFWSERQAQRIAHAIWAVLDVEFAPEVIVADANISTLTRRILASKQLLEP